MWKIAATLFTIWWTRLYLNKIVPQLPLFMRRRLYNKTVKITSKLRHAQCSRAMFRWAALNLAMRMQGSDLKKVVSFLLDVNSYGRCSFRRIKHEHDNWGYMLYYYDECKREEVFRLVRKYGQCTDKKPFLAARDVFGL